VEKVKDMTTNHKTLKNVQLDEVSLVDDPANPKARAVFFKRNEEAAMEKGWHDKDKMMKEMSDEQRRRFLDMIESGEDMEKAYNMVMRPMKKSSEGDIDMDIEELQAQFAELETSSQAMEKRAEAAEKHIEDLTKAVEELGFEVSRGKKGFAVAKAKEEEMMEFEGEMIVKSAIPAPILKHLEAKEAELAEIKKAAEQEELRKRAEEALPNLAGTPDQKALLLKSVEAIDVEEDREAVMKALQAADNAVSKSFEEVGTAPASDEGSASARLQKMAETFAEENGVDAHTAFAEVTKTSEGKQLMIEARSE
jgi:hypothetical protein